MLDRLNLHQVAALVQILDDGLSGLFPGHSLVFAAVFINYGAFVHHIDYRQVLPQAHFKVVGVMGRGDLYHAGSEVHFHVFVGNHRNLPSHQGQSHGFAHIRLVALVIRMHRYRGIAQQSLRAGGGQAQLAGSVGQRIAQVPEIAVMLVKLHLRVGNGGFAVRAPINDPLSTVNQAFFV